VHHFATGSSLSREDAGCFGVYRWLIDGEMDRPWSGETCRSCISLKDTSLLRILGDKLRSFLAGVGSATVTAAMGALNMSLKIPRCFFAFSVGKELRHSVKL